MSTSPPAQSTRREKNKTQRQETTLISRPAQHQLNFVRTSKFFSFYLELYIDKFKNLIWTSKLKFSFHGVYTGFLSQYNWRWWYYKIFTFLSIDMEILTPWSSQIHPEVQPKCVQATEGCWNIHISMWETIFFNPLVRVDWYKYSPKWNRACHVWRVTFFLNSPTKTK